AAPTVTSSRCGARRRSGRPGWNGWPGTTPPPLPGWPGCWTPRPQRSGRHLRRWCPRPTPLGAHFDTPGASAPPRAPPLAPRAAAGVLDGADRLTAAGLLHNLGGLAHSRGDAAMGIPLAERGWALRTDALGGGHPDVARDSNALGALYHLAGRYADADRAYRDALAVFA